MRNAHGYSFAIDFDGRKVDESDSFVCGHCQRIVFVKPKCSPADLGGNCRNCDRLVCPQCVKTGRCDPFEEKVQRAERANDTRRWFLEAMR